MRNREFSKWRKFSRSFGRPQTAAQRIGDEAVERLAQHLGKVQDDADREALPNIGRLVPMSADAVMVVFVTVIMACIVVYQGRYCESGDGYRAV